MAEHLIDGEFQSDKYPTTPRGKVPLSIKDVTAQPFIWEYAQVRRAVDGPFADDVEEALRIAGFDPPLLSPQINQLARVAISGVSAKLPAEEWDGLFDAVVAAILAARKLTGRAA